MVCNNITPFIWFLIKQIIRLSGVVAGHESMLDERQTIASGDRSLRQSWRWVITLIDHAATQMMNLSRS